MTTRNNKIRFAQIALGFVLLLSGTTLKPAFAQSPPVPPRIGDPIDYYKFKTTNWNSAHGFAPRSFHGIEGVTGWSTNLAMRIAGSGPAWLQYNYVDTGTNGYQTNITIPEGGISFWIRPLWTSTNLEGGTGPGVPARLLELGAFSEQGNWGWFSLFLDEAGTVLSLGVQSNQFTAVPIQAPISWASNEWHMVALNYTLTNMEFYVDGALASSVTNGLPFWPNNGVLLTNGFFIGSDSSGSNIANADFAYVRTYDWAIYPDMVGAEHNRVLTNYLQEIFAMNEMVGIGFNEFLDAGLGISTNGLSLGISFEGTNALLAVSGGTNGIPYDLFYTTNLFGSSVSQSSWTWLASVQNGNSYYLYDQPSPIFYMLGLTNDFDVDGLSDAFETLVSHSQTNNADSDADTLPDGWEWRNFSSFSQTASGDFDQDGTSNLQEYQQHSDPNTISFSPRLGNRYFNVINPTGTCEVYKGAPAYWAARVGSYSTNDIAWQPYSGQVSLSLGPTNGAYDVWIGLKGRAADSYPTWVGTTVYLDTAAPTVVLTNPVGSTVTRPIVQIQGYANEQLSSAVYSLTNTAGVFTNEQIFLTVGPDEAPANNLFQAFDVPLEPGTNRIGVNVSDLAGNSTSTILTYVLDYSGATNPVIEVTWPPEGTTVGSSNIYIMGRVDDETAEVRLSGDGLAFPLRGIVERNGTFWIEHLSLTAITNEFILTASNAAGLFTQTSLTIVQAPVQLNMNPVPEDQLNQSFVTVTGTISDPGYSVQVNEVDAVLDGYGNWIATNVPVNTGGTAIFTATASSGSFYEMFNRSEIMESSQSEMMESSLSNDLHLIVSSWQQDKPAEIKLVYGQWSYESSYIEKVLWLESYRNSWSWGIDPISGSTARVVYDWHSIDFPSDWTWVVQTTEVLEHHDPFYNCYYCDYTGEDTRWYYSKLGDGSSVSQTNSDAYPNFTGHFWPGWAPDGPWASGKVVDAYTNIWKDTCTNSMAANTRIVLRTGGKAGVNQRNIHELTALAYERTPGSNAFVYQSLAPSTFGYKRVNPANIAIPNYGSFGANGKKYLVLPDNQNIDVTLQVAGAAYYEYTLTAQKYKTHISANGMNLDACVPTFCVGQQITFSFIGLTNCSTTLGKWILPDKYVNETWCVTNLEFHTPMGSTNYRKNTDLLTNSTVSCWYVNGPGGKISYGANVILPDGLQSAFLSKKGYFFIHRPAFSRFLATINQFSWDSPTLQGGMAWHVQVDSLFDGYIGITQLLKGTGFYYDTQGEYVLDGRSEIYGEPDSSGPKAYYVTNSANAGHVTELLDSPHAPATPYVDMNAAFVDYLRFKPIGTNSIFITIATNGWYMDGSANLFTGMTKSNIPPATPPVNCDIIPQWVHQRMSKD